MSTRPPQLVFLASHFLARNLLKRLNQQGKFSCAVCLRARRARATLLVEYTADVFCCTPSSSSASPASTAHTPAQTLPKHPRHPWPCDGLLMPRCPTFQKHCTYRANRPRQSPASPPILCILANFTSIPSIPASPADQHPGFPASLASLCTPALAHVRACVRVCARRAWRTPKAYQAKTASRASTLSPAKPERMTKQNTLFAMFSA